MDVYKVAEFLRVRSAEDLASPDDTRRARGRVVAMVVGITANVPESVAPELLWLAGHYSGHPDWAELDENARTGTWAQDVTGEPTVLRAASVIEIRDPS